MESIESFEGTWRLRSFKQQTPAGVIHPYGKAAIGVIAYNSLGLMSVQIMSETLQQPLGQEFNPDEEPLFGVEPIVESHQVLAEAFNSYLAYFGRYSVDWNTRRITHFVEGSNHPGFLNRRLVRTFEFEHQLLRLNPPSHDASLTTLVWEKMVRTAAGKETGGTR